VSRRLWLALAPATALVAAVLTAAPFAAGAEGRLGLAEAAGPSFPERAYVLTLPTNRSLSASQVVVRENGDAVKGLTVTPPSAAQGNQFGVVLVIDASNSMKGKPIASALDAAQLFVGHQAHNQQVAVVTFNSKPQVVQPFTTDSSAILKSLAHTPPLAYGTHIYDAVLKGVQLLEQAQIAAGSIVLLSDGSDTGSTASRGDVVAAAKAAHVRVFSVGLRSRHFDPAALRSLAESASGTFSEATSGDDLSRIYEQLGTRLSREYLIRYQSFQGLGEKVHVSVKVSGVGAAASGYATPSLPAPVGTTYHRPFGNSFWASPFTMIVFSAFAIGLLGFCIFVLLQPKRRSVQRRLAEFVSLAQSTDGQSVGKQTPDRVAGPVENNVGGETTWWQRFLEELEIGEIEMKPAHIVLWTLAATIAFMWFIAVLFTFAAVILGLLIPFTVWSFVKRKADRKRTQFAEQLPDNLAVLASAIRAGHSFVGALSVVVNDAPEPARSEFQRVVADEQLGRPLDEALETVVYRMRNQDLAQVALVAALQRETGGSTAEVLDRVVDTVRDRQELRRLVKTLTAAGRMSRWVVTFLPVALILAILILSPSYLHPLFSHTSGKILFVFAAVLVIGGSLVIKRIVDIKV
jgi:tight adherence protein B